jgi:APA family basic amino acid/polyamine antiporter
MAAVAITFARYFLDLTHLPVADGWVAAAALASLTAINCLGVRAGSNVQSALMLLKILAIAAMVLCGLVLAGTWSQAVAPARMPERGMIGAIGAALTPVMFAYGGWQTASFVAAEMRDPRRDLAKGVLLGVAGVVLLYTAVAFTCVAVLGPQGLAETRTPATAVMRAALGENGATLIALGIAISALGFMSQGMLTTPRVYFAMAEDRLFFAGVARVDARTRAPVAAILLQGVVAIVIALSGSYGQILSYVVSVDFIWFGLTGAALFVFRRRDRKDAAWFQAPGHPVTTGLFVAACALVVAATVWNSPADSAIGLFILLAGIPAYLYWRRKRDKAG